MRFARSRMQRPVARLSRVPSWIALRILGEAEEAQEAAACLDRSVEQVLCSDDHQSIAKRRMPVLYEGLIESTDQLVAMEEDVAVSLVEEFEEVRASASAVLLLAMAEAFSLLDNVAIETVRRGAIMQPVVPVLRVWNSGQTIRSETSLGKMGSAMTCGGHWG